MTIAITVAPTVGSGIIVFVIGQVFVVLFLERIRTQARCVEEIAQVLVMYGPFYSNPEPSATSTERKERARSSNTDIRRLAALIRANSQTLGLYKLWRILGLVLPKDRVVAASRALILLSNVCPPNGNNQSKAGIASRDETMGPVRIDSK